MPRVHVTSEIGSLRSVLVHTPGKELVAVTPGTREDYLYDDIIDLEIAQREHRRLVAILERFAEVHEVRDTLVEIAGRPEVREFLTTRARAERGRIRAPPAAEPVLHARRRHCDRRARDHRVDAPRRALDGGAADQGPVPLRPEVRERRHSLRRLRREAHQLHARRW